MHFLKINFGMQWTCSSGQSMIIIVTFPTLAKHYQKSQFMNYENIIHHCGSKKAPTQSNSNIRQEEVVKKEQNYVCIVFQALNQEHCFQKELEPEIPEKSPKSLSQKLKFGSSSVLWKENALKQSIYSCYSSYIMCLRSTFFFAFSSLLLLRLHYQCGCKFRVTFGYLLCLQNALKLFRGKKAHFMQTKMTMAH